MRNAFIVAALVLASTASTTPSMAEDPCKTGEYVRVEISVRAGDTPYLFRTLMTCEQSELLKVQLKEPPRVLYGTRWRQ